MSEEMTGRDWVNLIGNWILIFAGLACFMACLWRWPEEVGTALLCLVVLLLLA